MISIKKNLRKSIPLLLNFKVSERGAVPITLHGKKQPVAAVPAREAGLVRKSFFVVALLGMVAAACVPGFGSDATWTGGAGGAFWGTPEGVENANWDTGSAPSTTGIATFNNAGGGVGTTISLCASSWDAAQGNAGSQSINGLIFDNTGGALASYTIGAGGANHDSLTLGDDGWITMNDNVNADQLIAAAIVLGPDSAESQYVFTNNSMNTLEISGNIIGGSGGIAGAKSLTVTGSYGRIVLSGDIADGGATTLSLIKNGDTTLVLSGSNSSYSGATLVNDGILQIQSAAALGSDTGGVSVANGATLDLYGDFDVSTEAVELANGSTLLSGFGTNSMAGTVSITGTSTVGVSGTQLTLSGVISGDNLTKAHDGTLILSGENTYTGITTINQGTLTATTSAQALGAGTLTISGGALRLANDTLLHFDRNVTVSGNAAINSDTLTGVEGVTHRLGTLSIGNNTLTVGLGTMAASGIQGLQFGVVTLSGDATINANDGAGDAGSLLTLASVDGASYNLAVGGSADTLISGVVGNVGELIKAGTGILTLGADNTYTGGTTVTAGTLIDAGSLHDASDLTVNGATAEFDLGADHSDTVGTVTLRGDGRITGTGSSALTSDVDFGMESGTVTAILAGDGIGLNKTTDGTVTLSGANTYNGVTAISEGTLIATTSAQALGAGTLAISGGTLSLANNTLLNFDRNVTVSGDAAINSDTLAPGAGVTHRLGTLEIGAHTLTVGLGTTATSLQGLTFGVVTLTGDANIVANDDASGGILTLASVGGAGHSLTIGGGSTADITVTGAVNIAGGNDEAGGNLSVTTTGNISGGTITTSGGVDTGLGQKSGGDVTLDSSAGSVSVSTITAQSGTDTSYTTTGHGGAVSITAGLNVTTGDISSAGLYCDPLGGSGGSIDISAGQNISIGNLLSSGGDAYYDGGVGGDVNINGPGTTVITSIGTSGGNSTAADGGNAGSVTLSGGAGTVTVNGAINTLGGNSAGSSMEGQDGGDGGDVTILGGTVTVTGTISTTGGSSVAGDAGANGKLIINDGRLNFSNLVGGGDIDMGVALSSSGILSYTGSARTLSNAINILGDGSDTIQNSGSGLLTLSGMITKNGTTLVLNGGAQGITISGRITGASDESDLVVSGGTVTLSHDNNDYNGPTYVYGGGTLKNGIADALPLTTTVTLGESATDTAGTYDLNGFSSSIAELMSAGTGDKIVTNSGGSDATLTVTGASTFSGVIQDGGTNSTSLTKSGAGTFVLGGANTYTGATEVSGGTLQLNQSLTTSSGLSFTGAGTVDLASGTTLGMNVTTTASGQGTLRLLGSNTVNGNIGDGGPYLNLTTVGTGDNTINGYVLGNLSFSSATGNLALNGGLSDGNLSFFGDNTLTLGNNESINGTVASGVDGQGTLEFLGIGQVTQSIGAFGAGNALELVTINGASVVVTANVAATTINFAVAGGSLSLVSVEGNVTTSNANTGTLVVEGSSITGNVGDITGGGGTDKELALVTLNTNAVTTLDGDMAATEINFSNDGLLSLGTGKTIEGNVTTGTEGVGTLSFAGIGTMDGNIGDLAGGGGTDKELALVTITGGAVSSTGNIAATGINFSAAGGSLTIANTKTVEGNVTATTPGQGTLTFAGAGTMTGDIGASGSRIALLDANGTITTSGHVYATQVDVGAGSTFGDAIGDVTVTNILNIQNTGTTTVSGTLNSVDGTTGTAVTLSAAGTLDVNGAANILTLAYGANDGTVILASNSTVNSTITATGDGVGTLTLEGPATISGAVGTGTGNDLKVINAGASGTSSFGGNVYANTVNVTGTGTLAMTSGADLTGAVSFADDGTLALSAGSDVTGAITNSEGNPNHGNMTTAGDSLITGTVGAVGNGRLGSMAVNGGAGTTARMTGAVFATDAALGAGILRLDSAADITTTTLSGTGTLELNHTLTGNVVNGGNLLTVTNTGAGSGAIHGVISGNGGLTKTGTGTVTLSGANAYIGTTLVSGGTLALSHASGNNLSSSTILNVASGAELDVSGLASGAGLTLAATGQTLTGSGTVTGDLTIGTGGILSPGTSPGTLVSDGNVTYDGGGTYQWELNQADVTQGANPGWDFHSISGILDIGASSLSKFTIDITGLGAVTNFNKYANFTWTIATAGVPVTNFAADAFTLLKANFTNNNNINGTATDGDFSITTSGNDLQVIYTAAVNLAPDPIYWNGTTGANWNTHTLGGVSNWVSAGGAEANAVPDSASNVHFYYTGAGNLTTTLGENFTINSLTMDSGTNAVIIGGNTLTLNDSDAITMEDTAGALTINSNVSLGGAQTWLNDSANDLTVNGAVATDVYLLTVSGTGDTAITSVISGTGALTKTGEGTLQLSGAGANTYSGVTTVSEGTLELNKTGVNAIAGNLTVNGAGTVTLLQANQIADTSAVTVSGGTLNVAHSDTVGAVTLSSGAISGAGTLTGSSYALTNSGTVSAVLAGAGVTLTKTGSGTATLSGNNTYTGLTDVQAGTLSLGRAGGTIADTAAVTVSGGTLDVANSDTVGAVTLSSGAISGEGTLTGSSYALTNSGTVSAALGGAGVTLTKTGAGTATLSGANTYTGATAVNAGTLVLSGGAAITDTGAVSLANVAGATLMLEDDETLGALSGGGGTGGNVNLQAYTLTVGNADDTLFSGVISGANGSLVKQGSGALTLNGVNTYTGFTTVDAGTLNLNQTLAGDLEFSGDGIVNLAGGKNIGGTVTAASGVGTLRVTGGDNSTISGQIGENAARLKAMEIDLDVAKAATLESDVFAVTTTISDLGALNLNGNLTGTTLNFTANGTVNLADGSAIAAAITTSQDNQGKLNFEGDHTTGGALGVSGMGLSEVNIQNGTLIMAHNVAATEVKVDSVAGGGAGTLTMNGNRTIYGDLTVLNSGVLNLGTNTLLLEDAGAGDGQYTQGAGTRLNLSINSASVFGNIVGDGNASVALASTVYVSVADYIANGTTFTIIDGAGGVEVNVPATIEDNSSILNFSGSVVNGDLILTANRTNSYAGLAPNPNAAAAGQALENAGAAGATGDMLNVLNTLDSMSDEAVGQSLETMTPDVSAGTMETTRTLNGHFLTAINNRLAYARNGFASGTGIATGDMVQGTGFWMQGLGGHEKQRERQGIQGYQANTFGTTMGFDKLLDRHFRMGAAGGYGFGAIRSKTPGSPSTDVNSFQGTVYGSFDSVDLCEARKNRKYSRTAVRNQGERLWYVDGMLSFSQNNYDSRREIWLGADQRVAKSDHYGQQYGTKFETGYTLLSESTRDLEMTPFVSLGYNYLRMNKYKEKGADSLDLRVDGDGFNQLEQGLGLKLAYPVYSEKSGTFIPSIKGAWLYDYIADRFETNASFAGGGTSFETVGFKPARNAFLLGSELAFLNKGNMTLTGNFDWILRDAYASYTYYLTARFDF